MLDDPHLGREFFRVLVEVDEAVTRRVAVEGCPVCDGPLHRSDYDRKPRGARVVPAGEAFARRFSLCCRREGCRMRAMSPSVRFLGRRVYLGAVVIPASIVALALLRAAANIWRRTGVPARTTRRWLGWWQGPFLRTGVFVSICARLIGVDVGPVPASIVDRIEGTQTQQVRTMLELLAPLTTISVPDGSRFLRGSA
ncbi:hypothetical protein [Sorangium sp. So ce381]|uniref:hypothetical protein n=1 Tax=Sorangium sp. So ce381 TaxID=3133307 RepID=UPI003F5B0B0D